MSNKDVQIGTVLDALPNIEFKVELEGGRVIRCYLAGKMRVYNINVLVGDKVEVVVPPQSEIGRIVRRK